MMPPMTRLIASAGFVLTLAAGCGGEKVVYKAEVAANSGIERGDEVYVADEQVGEVERVEEGEAGFGEPHEIITMELEQESLTELREDALLIAFGEAGRVRFDPGHPSQRPLPPGSTIPIEQTSVCGEGTFSRREELTAQAQRLLEGEHEC